VLAQRDPRDWYCFEAASWALAAQRMPVERRRQLWQEPLPAVELACRIRELPIFAFSSVDELFRVAGLGRQIRHEAGRVIFERGAPPDTLQFLLDGRAATDGAATTEQLMPPAPLAFEAVLEGRPVAAEIRAIDSSICLSLTGDEFLSLLAENVELTEGIFRWLIEFRRLDSQGAVSHGRLTPELERKIAGGLQPVDRVLLLQASPLLTRATGTQLLRLAGLARPVTFKAGADAFAGHAEPGLLVVLTGAVDVTGPDGRVERAGAGDSIGLIATLGGLPLNGTARAATDGTALRFNRTDVFDLLADETPLMQGLFSSLLASAELRIEQPVPGVRTVSNPK
jgi:CRP-like cAMP-binding protein